MQQITVSIGEHLRAVCDIQKCKQTERYHVVGIWLVGYPWETYDQLCADARAEINRAIREIEDA